MDKFSCAQNLLNSSCFDGGAGCGTVRLNLPVALANNIKYKSFSGRRQKPGEARLGSGGEIISPLSALISVRKAAQRESPIKIVRISGPGDPLANNSTFETLGLIRAEFPELTKCLSTNGLLLMDRLGSLMDVKVDTIAVTVNTLRPWIGMKLCDYVDYQGERFYGEAASRLLLSNQIKGIEKALKYGLKVIVNSVLIPGINEEELPELASILKGAGVRVMNIVPLAPQTESMSLAQVSSAAVNRVQQGCEKLGMRVYRSMECLFDEVRQLRENWMPVTA
jgi:nitrogen fixation protein NifB